jgi:autotransporter family porin
MSKLRLLPLVLVLALGAILAAAPASGDPTRPERAHTRAVGSPALSDAAAAARVTRTGWEVRPDNAAANGRVPTRRELAVFRARSTMPYRHRVTGRFRGTTDEILQWAAHKHGIDEDLLRAVAVRETFWRMSFVGDAGDSFGIMQLRRPFHCCLPTMARSTAFNVDYYAAITRAYYDGRMGWLNTVGRGREYRAGDMWGSVGAWYTGRWHTVRSRRYMDDVRAILDARTWETEDFSAAGA